MLSDTIANLRGTIITGDLNSQKTTGIYSFYGSNVTNGPETGNGIYTLQVIKYTGDWVDQICTRISEDGGVWKRSFHSGTSWGTWQKLLLKSSITPILVDKTSTSSYVRVDDAAITSSASSAYVFQPMYQSGAIGTYVTTIQALSGYSNIYIRKTDGTNVPDGTRVYGFLWVYNYN